MFNPDMKYQELKAYRDEAERRADNHRTATQVRSARRMQRRMSQFKAMRISLMANVGRRMVAWGTHLQEQYGSPDTAYVPTMNPANGR